jgi:hypothetical protein
MRLVRLQQLILAGATIASAVVAGTAQADVTPAADFGLAFSSQLPSSSTGVALHILFKDPADPDAKPSPQRKIVIALPAGARIDGSAVPACTATDAELMARGPAACPAGSQVGDGTLTLTTGGGPLFDPFVDDVKLFNGGNELVEIFNKQGNDTTTAIGRRTYTDPQTLTETPAPQPGGPPNGESAVRLIEYRLDPHGSSNRPFIRTPPACPTTETWISNLTFTTADGATNAARASTACRTRPAVAKPRIRVTVTPRRVKIGKRTRFHIQLRAVGSRCASRAIVHIAGAGSTRADVNGRAALTARFARPGGRLVTARHHGCRVGRAQIVALSG